MSLKVRSLPKKQSSMQKLMAKMKEIKLRVTGKGEDSVCVCGGGEWCMRTRVTCVYVFDGHDEGD